MCGLVGQVEGRVETGATGQMCCALNPPSVRPSVPSFSIHLHARQHNATTRREKGREGRKGLLNRGMGGI